MAGECVYVGDAVTDAIAANGAGMHFIAVLESGLRQKEDFKKVRVDFFAKKFSDTVSYLKRY
jgi:phosphoglycolate phosphatase-like HAD superfamily hydrolase